MTLCHRRCFMTMRLPNGRNMQLNVTDGGLCLWKPMSKKSLAVEMLERPRQLQNIAGTWFCAVVHLAQDYEDMRAQSCEHGFQPNCKRSAVLGTSGQSVWECLGLIGFLSLLRKTTAMSKAKAFLGPCQWPHKALAAKTPSS